MTINIVCSLVLDAICIRKQLVWDKVWHTFIGYCDFGHQVEIENERNSSPSTECLVFMLVSINRKWKIFSKIKSHLLHNQN